MIGGVVGFALVVVAEGEIVSALEEVTDAGVAKVGTRVVLIHGTEGVALPVGLESPVSDETCPCVFGY